MVEDEMLLHAGWAAITRFGGNGVNWQHGYMHFIDYIRYDIIPQITFSPV
jgi:hypothetical protein